jgi:hypothetical protein
VKLGAVLGLSLVACAIAPRPPASVSICATAGCTVPETVLLFWGGDPAPFPTERIGDVQVRGAEVQGTGIDLPTRQDLLDALARKAKAMGADALTNVEVFEPLPGHRMDPTTSMTGVEPPPESSAQGVAVRRPAEAKP